MKKIFLSMLFLILLVGVVSALSINEVELNPEGGDFNNQWIELYSADEVNLDGYALQNSQGEFYELSGIFSGYQVINFPGEFLLHENELVHLWNGAELVDATEILSDVEDNELSWGICDIGGGTWYYAPASDGEDNSCPGGNGGYGGGGYGGGGDSFNFCVDGEQGGNLEIDNVNLKNYGYGSNYDVWMILDVIEADIDVENNGNETLENIIVEIGFLDGDENEINEINFISGSVENELELEPGQDDDVEVLFELPAGLQEGEYKFVVKAYDADVGEEFECTSTADFEEGAYQPIYVEGAEIAELKTQIAELQEKTSNLEKAIDFLAKELKTIKETVRRILYNL